MAEITPSQAKALLNRQNLAQEFESWKARKDLGPFEIPTENQNNDVYNRAKHLADLANSNSDVDPSLQHKPGDYVAEATKQVLNK